MGDVEVDASEPLRATEYFCLIRLQFVEFPPFRQFPARHSEGKLTVTRAETGKNWRGFSIRFFFRPSLARCRRVGTGWGRRMSAPVEDGRVKGIGGNISF